MRRVINALKVADTEAGKHKGMQTQVTLGIGKILTSLLGSVDEPTF